MITFDREPGSYQHWMLTFDGPVATLTLDVNEDDGIDDGYKLKLNSYDLGVDIELHDALDRIRFEHPEVGAVVLASGKERMFCAGANIYMLGKATHAWKVNFCKFTNETRNGIEDSSEHSGLKFLAARERHRRRRRLRAGAGLRRDRAGRRPLAHGQLARGAAAGGAAGDGRTDAAGRQAQACAATSPTSSAPRPRASGGDQAPRSGGSSTTSSPPRLFPEKVQERATRSREQTDRPTDAQGHRPHAAQPHDR